MRPPDFLPRLLVGASAFLIAGTTFLAGRDGRGAVSPAEAAPVSAMAVGTSITLPTSTPTTLSAGAALATDHLAVAISTALAAFASAVLPLSHPNALEHAFRGYFAYRAAHPEQVRKPYLFFVDYGLPSTRPRGYLFDMKKLEVIEGPFTVAHGRGSSDSRFGTPTRFSNAVGSGATSLGLYVARATYAFRGRSAGRSYGSIGLRLMGVSRGFNDNALRRAVVAHGAPYVTPSQAGRSEGCPAMEPSRARRLLPKLANGGVVFLFAPNEPWMSRDPWLASGAE